MLIPMFRRDFGKRQAGGDADIENEPVHATGFGEKGVDGAADRLRVADIGDDGDRAAPFGGYAVADLGCRLRRDVDDADEGSLAGGELRYGAAIAERLVRI